VSAKYLIVDLSVGIELYEMQVNKALGVNMKLTLVLAISDKKSREIKTISSSTSKTSQLSKAEVKS
jgi:hypothetical protein